MYFHDTTRGSLRGLPNLQLITEWGEARSKAQSDFSRGGLRTLSRRGSGVRIPSPAPFLFTYFLLRVVFEGEKYSVIGRILSARRRVKFDCLY